MKPVTHKARIERKHATLPRYVVIPAEIPQAWELNGTTTVVGTLNGVDMGRRGLKNWGDGKRWFFELPEPLCRAAGVDTGDVITLTFAPCEPVPTEVRALISCNDAFARTWATLTPGRQRQFCEWVASAKQPSTRENRARSLTASKP